MACKFYLPQNTRTQFSQVLCHFRTMMASPQFFMTWTSLPSETTPEWPLISLCTSAFCLGLFMCSLRNGDFPSSLPCFFLSSLTRITFYAHISLRVSSHQSKVFWPRTSEFLQLLPTTQFQSCFHIFRYLYSSTHFLVPKPVLACSCCHNRVPKTGGLNNRNVLPHNSEAC